MRFKAEVIKVEAKKTASLDREIRITLTTEDPESLKLQDAISNYIVEVNAEREVTR